MGTSPSKRASAMTPLHRSSSLPSTRQAKQISQNYYPNPLLQQSPQRCASNLTAIVSLQPSTKQHSPSLQSTTHFLPHSIARSESQILTKQHVSLVSHVPPTHVHQILPQQQLQQKQQQQQLTQLYMSSQQQRYQSCEKERTFSRSSIHTSPQTQRFHLPPRVVHQTEIPNSFSQNKPNKVQDILSNQHSNSSLNQAHSIIPRSSHDKPPLRSSSPNLIFTSLPREPHQQHQYSPDLQSVRIQLFQNPNNNNNFQSSGESHRLHKAFPSSKLLKNSTQDSPFRARTPPKQQLTTTTPTAQIASTLCYHPQDGNYYIHQTNPHSHFLPSNKIIGNHHHHNKYSNNCETTTQTSHIPLRTSPRFQDSHTESQQGNQQQEAQQNNPCMIFQQNNNNYQFQNKDLLTPEKNNQNMLPQCITDIHQTQSQLLPSAAPAEAEQKYKSDCNPNQFNHTFNAISSRKERIPHEDNYSSLESIEPFINESQETFDVKPLLRQLTCEEDQTDHVYLTLSESLNHNLSAAQPESNSHRCQRTSEDEYAFHDHYQYGTVLNSDTNIIDKLFGMNKEIEDSKSNHHNREQIPQKAIIASAKSTTTTSHVFREIQYNSDVKLKRNNSIYGMYSSKKNGENRERESQNEDLGKLTAFSKGYLRNINSEKKQQQQLQSQLKIGSKNDENMSNEIYGFKSNQKSSQQSLNVYTKVLSKYEKQLNQQAREENIRRKELYGKKQQSLGINNAPNGINNNYNNHNQINNNNNNRRIRGNSIGNISAVGAANN